MRAISQGTIKNNNNNNRNNNNNNNCTLSLPIQFIPVSVQYVGKNMYVQIHQMKLRYEMIFFVPFTDTKFLTHVLRL